MKSDHDKLENENKFLQDTLPEDKALPAFMVSTTRGFLPRAEPVVDLPEEFRPLESILSRMPIKRLDGTPGLLAKGRGNPAGLIGLYDPLIRQVLRSEHSLGVTGLREGDEYKRTDIKGRMSACHGSM